MPVFCTGVPSLPSPGPVPAFAVSRKTSRGSAEGRQPLAVITPEAQKPPCEASPGASPVRLTGQRRFQAMTPASAHQDPAQQGSDGGEFIDQGEGSWSPPATPLSETKHGDPSQHGSPGTALEEAWSPPLYNPTPVGAYKRPHVHTLSHAEPEDAARGILDIAHTASKSASGPASGGLQHHQQADDWINLPETLDDDPIPSWPPCHDFPSTMGVTGQQTAPDLARSEPAQSHASGAQTMQDRRIDPDDLRPHHSASRVQAQSIPPRPSSHLEHSISLPPSSSCLTHSPRQQPQQQHPQSIPLGMQADARAGERPAANFGHADTPTTRLQQQQPQAQKGLHGRGQPGTRPLMSQLMSQGMSQPGSRQQRRSGGSSWLLQAARATGQIPSAPRPSQFSPSQHLSRPSGHKPVSGQPQSIAQTGHPSDVRNSGKFMLNVPRHDASTGLLPHAHGANASPTVMQAQSCAGIAAGDADISLASDDVLGASGPEEAHDVNASSVVEDEAIPPTPLSGTKLHVEHNRIMREALSSPGSLPLAQRLNEAAEEAALGMTHPSSLPDGEMAQGSVPLAARLDASWQHSSGQHNMMVPAGRPGTEADNSLPRSKLAGTFNLHASSQHAAEPVSDIPLASRVESRVDGNPVQASKHASHRKSPQGALLRGDGPFLDTCLDQPLAACMASEQRREALRVHDHPTTSSRHASEASFPDLRSEMSLAARMAAEHNSEAPRLHGKTSAISQAAAAAVDQDAPLASRLAAEPQGGSKHAPALASDVQPTGHHAEKAGDCESDRREGLPLAQRVVSAVGTAAESSQPVNLTQVSCIKHGTICMH